VDVPEEVMEENMHRALSSVVLDRRAYLVYQVAYLKTKGSGCSSSSGGSAVAVQPSPDAAYRRTFGDVQYSLSYWCCVAEAGISLLVAYHRSHSDCDVAGGRPLDP
jgi:hypothetical protein